MIQTIDSKKEYVHYSLMTWFALLVAFITAKFINSSYKGNIEEAKKIAEEILLNPAMAQPEPKEKAIFFGSIIITILGMLLFYTVTQRFFTKKNFSVSSTLGIIVTTINVVIVGYLLHHCFTAENPFFKTPQNSHDVETKSNFDFYFTQSFLHKNVVIYSVFIVPLIVFGLLKKINISLSLQQLINRSVTFMCIGLGILACAISIFIFPNTFENKYDFNAIFYSVVQVYHGFPLLVDEFTNTYGMYPHFIVPVLKLTGFTILSFTTILGLLLFVCFGCLYYFLHKTIDNKVILLLGFCAVFFMCFGYQKIAVNYDAIYSTHPIRWLFPMLLFAYIPFYYLKQTAQAKSFLFRKIFFLKFIEIEIIKLLSFFVFSFGILWSPDFGTFSFLSLIAFYLFAEFNSNAIKQSVVKAILTLLLAFMMLVFAFMIYSICIKLAYGSSPDILLLFKTIATFSSIGFGMLPMPSGFHPWMLVAVVYIVGWVISINHFFKNQKSLFSISVFVLTFMGTIGLTYYQGRSHNWNLFVTNFEAFILLTLYASELHKQAKLEKLFIAPFAITVLLIAFAPLQIMSGFSKFQELIYAKKDKVKNQAEQNNIMATSTVINSICSEGEPVLILSADHYQGLYHYLSKTTSCVSPGFVELFTKKRYNQILEKLKQGNYKIFLEPQFYRPTNTKLLNIMGAYYELNTNENMPSLYYYKKKEFAKYQPILNDNTNALFYINTNVNGEVNLKLQEASSKAIQLGDKFTVDIVFTPSSNAITDINKGGTILSNLDGNKGFVIQQQNPNQYIFAFKGRGIVCNVELNKSTKMTFKIDGINLSCYVNDVLQSQAMVTEHYENSTQSLCIGSIQNKSNFFLGIINEIKINELK